MRKLPERKTLPTAVGLLGPDRVAVSAFEQRPGGVPSPAPVSVPPPVVQPLAPSRYKVQFTASVELHHKLERLRARLEYHHLRPFGMGGDHSPSNIRLSCKSHNAYLAEHDYGKAAMARYQRSGSRVFERAVSSTGSAERPGGRVSP